MYAYYLKRDPMLRELQTLPIAGNTAPIRVGFACPRTAWGKATALKIGSILATRDGVQMLRQSSERWLSGESRQRYSAMLEDFYHARENPALGLTPP